MTDSHQESDSQLDGLPANGMGERLWRRATEPLGVIDVRYAQQKYFSALRWLNERTALLDLVRSRYGVEEMLAGGEHLFAAHPLFAAQHPPGQQVNLFSTTIQSFSPAAQAQATSPDAPQDWTGRDVRPSSLAEVIDGHSPKPDVEQEAAPERKFRISRRPSAMLSKSAVVSPVRQPQAASSIQPPPDEASASQQARSDTTSPRAGSVSATEQPPHDGRVAESPITNRAAQDFVFKKSVVESSGAEVGSPLLSRSIQTARESQSAGVIAQTYIDSSQPPSGDRMAVVAPEIRDVSLNPKRPGIVYRKQPDGLQIAHSMAKGSGTSAPSSPVQFTDTASALSPQQGGQTAMSAKARMQNPQMQSEQPQVEHLSPQVIRTISERVIRAITLDLKVERERRGNTKWR